MNKLSAILICVLLLSSIISLIPSTPVHADSLGFILYPSSYYYNGNYYDFFSDHFYTTTGGVGSFNLYSVPMNLSGRDVDCGLYDVTGFYTGAPIPCIQMTIFYEHGDKSALEADLYNGSKWWPFGFPSPYFTVLNVSCDATALTVFTPAPDIYTYTGDPPGWTVAEGINPPMIALEQVGSQDTLDLGNMSIGPLQKAIPYGNYVYVLPLNSGGNHSNILRINASNTNMSIDWMQTIYASKPDGIEGMMYDDTFNYLYVIEQDELYHSWLYRYDTSTWGHSGEFEMQCKSGGVWISPEDATQYWLDGNYLYALAGNTMFRVDAKNMSNIDEECRQSKSIGPFEHWNFNSIGVDSSYIYMGYSYDSYYNPHPDDTPMERVPKSTWPYGGSTYWYSANKSDVETVIASDNKYVYVTLQNSDAYHESMMIVNRSTMIETNYINDSPWGIISPTVMSTYELNRSVLNEKMYTVSVFTFQVQVQPCTHPVYEDTFMDKIIQIDPSAGSESLSYPYKLYGPASIDNSGDYVYSVSLGINMSVRSPAPSGEYRLVRFYMWGNGSSLPPPTDLTATGVTSKKIYLTWTPAPEATGTMIRRSANGYPATVDSGTLVYMGSGDTVNDSEIEDDYNYNM